jgi:hypothetical protein
VDGTRLAELLDARKSPHVAALLNEQPNDTTQPAALTWLKRWGPEGLMPKPRACSCTSGHCQICN